MNNTATNQFESDIFDSIQRLFENDENVTRAELEDMGCTLEENKQLQSTLAPWRERLKVLQELAGKQPTPWFQEILKSLSEDLFEKTTLKGSQSTRDKQIDHKLEVVETPLLIDTLQNNPSGPLHTFKEALFLKYIPEILQAFKAKIGEVEKNLTMQEVKLQECNTRLETAEGEKKNQGIKRQGKLQLRISEIENELAELHSERTAFIKNFANPESTPETLFSIIEKLAEKFGIQFGIEPLIADLEKIRGSMIISIRPKKNREPQKVIPNEGNNLPFSPQSKIAAVVVAVVLAIGGFITLNKEKPRPNDTSFPTNNTPPRSAPNNSPVLPSNPDERSPRQEEKMNFAQLQLGLTKLNNDPEGAVFLLDFYRKNPGKIDATPYTAEGVKMISNLPSENLHRQIILSFTTDPNGNASWQTQDISFTVKGENTPFLIQAYEQHPKSPFLPQPHFPNPNAPRPSPYQPFP